MAATTTKLDELAKEILADALADFQARKLTSEDLSDGYEGLKIAELETKYCSQGRCIKVDFDLAVKDLEKTKLIDTGPMEPYNNEPDSSVAIFAIFSKREFLYLTEKGYREAQKPATKPLAPRGSVTQVHISGSTFNNSPVAAGAHINQEAPVHIENTSEVIEHLFKLLTDHSPSAGEKEKQEIAALVDTAKTGDTPQAKTIFQRVFGATTEAAKAASWAIIVDILKAHMHMSWT